MELGTDVADNNRLRHLCVTKSRGCCVLSQMSHNCEIFPASSGFLEFGYQSTAHVWHLKGASAAVLYIQQDIVSVRMTVSIRENRFNGRQKYQGHTEAALLRLIENIFLISFSYIVKVLMMQNVSSSNNFANPQESFASTAADQFGFHDLFCCSNSRRDKNFFIYYFKSSFQTNTKLVFLLPLSPTFYFWLLCLHSEAF